jgi:hypothetical protein
MGKDGFYVFLAEFQGRATLRADDGKSPEHPTFDVPIDQVMSLELESSGNTSRRRNSVAGFTFFRRR